MTKLAVILKKTFFDLKSILYYDHSSNLKKGVVNVFRKNYIFTNNGVSPSIRISKVRQSLSRQLQSKKFFMPRSVSLYGICSTYLSRKPTRHRVLSSFNEKQNISYGHPFTDISPYVSKGKQKSGLAYLRRLRPNLDQQSPKAVRQRFFRIRFERNSLCSRFLHDRFMSFFVSMGAFPQKKRRDKTSHTFRPERPYPRIHQSYRWLCARCEYLRRSCYRAWRFLHIRPWVSRFRKIISSQRTSGVFYYPYKKEFSIPENLFSSSRQITWTNLRPNDLLNRILFKTTLPGKTSTYPVFRFRNTEISHVLNKQFQSSGNNHSTTLQMPLASRIILQMDQAAFANKSVLWNEQKRCKNSSLDSNCYLRVNRDYQKTVKNRAKSLHNITNFECYYVRENPHFTGVCGA